ncbi:MAG TPA: hybrid sensor histidine kinase/response regulator [Chthoniobacterales bacterium]|nr:hybrid sensor histidine kinase/response regulator [Chthoniobacterales bacterium]
MSAKDPNDLSEFSMTELFRLEVENQSVVFTENLLGLEADPTDASRLEALMRAAHSLKGAARMVDRDAAVSVAHELEDVFVAAQQGSLVLLPEHVDLLLRGVDLLQRIAQAPDDEIETEKSKRAAEVQQLLGALAKLRIDDSSDTESSQSEDANGSATITPKAQAAIPSPSNDVEDAKRKRQRFLRVTPENLNRLLALTGESLVESRRLVPFLESLLRIKRQHNELTQILDQVRELLSLEDVGEHAEVQVAQARAQLMRCREDLSERLLELESFHRRSANLSHRLYDEALACRMRPFADGIHGFPRMVRDLARDLGKQVRLEIRGPDTYVDRDILEKLEAPLTHLLRNAIDHGIELPEVRRVAGKSVEGNIRLEAQHSAGNLLITISDDGRGVDLAELRNTIVQKNLTSPEAAEQMSDSEVLEFLLLPGFTMKQTITEISGRGVGLDAVQAIVREVRGAIRIWTDVGRGTTLQMQLPLTLSIVRALLVEIGDEPYAFPLVHINRALKVAKKDIQITAGRQHFRFQDRQIGLIAANRIFGGREDSYSSEQVSVVVVGNQANCYGIVTEKFLGERELVIRPLDPRLGKIKDISSGALLDDGSPVLIVDVEDLIRSIEKNIEAGTSGAVQNVGREETQKRPKRVLVVDDSLTVRELEKKLLQTRHYEVEVAVDGMDGWNAARTGHFDLVITDIDMPRMDGIELVTLIKKASNLKSLPVMIVSYKDRAEDRQRGLDAGADYYLVKAGFHDEALLQAVVNLIGEATE